MAPKGLGHRTEGRIYRGPAGVSGGLAASVSGPLFRPARPSCENRLGRSRPGRARAASGCTLSHPNGRFCCQPFGKESGKGRGHMLHEDKGNRKAGRDSRQQGCQRIGSPGRNADGHHVDPPPHNADCGLRIADCGLLDCGSCTLHPQRERNLLDTSNAATERFNLGDQVVTDTCMPAATLPTLAGLVT